MNEIWKPIKFYENLYQVSNLGRIRSLDKKVPCRGGKLRLICGKIRSLQRDSNGYLSVILCNNNIKCRYRVHRIVAETFIPNPENKPCVDHIDTNIENNQVSNLRWVTYTENSLNTLTTEKMSKSKSGKNCYFFGKIFGNKIIKSIDLMGNTITYNSIKEASRCGYTYSSIQHALYSHKKYANLIWEYA